MENRIASFYRKTKETDIQATFNIDGSGIGKIDTGVPFFDHMLEGFAKHGLFDLELKVIGDLAIDTHHTVEDAGIVLGSVVAKALDDKVGIKRYGSFILPMDETLALCAIDLSGRPYLNYEANFTVEKIGDLDTEMIKEFFYAFTYNCGLNLHMKILDGSNNHHIAEALFKAFGKALDVATMKDTRVSGVWSTKGSL